MFGFLQIIESGYHGINHNRMMKGFQLVESFDHVDYDTLQTIHFRMSEILVPAMENIFQYNMINQIILYSIM